MLNAALLPGARKSRWGGPPVDRTVADLGAELVGAINAAASSSPSTSAFARAVIARVEVSAGSGAAAVAGCINWTRSSTSTSRPVPASGGNAVLARDALLPPGLHLPDICDLRRRKGVLHRCDATRSMNRAPRWGSPARAGPISLQLPRVARARSRRHRSRGAHQRADLPSGAGRRRVYAIPSVAGAASSRTRRPLEGGGGVGGSSKT